MRRKVDLVLDGDGDVIMVRVDHHSGQDGRDVLVPWGNQTPTPKTSVVTVAYVYPKRKPKR